MTYELWDKITPVNGIDAVDLIGAEQMANNDPFVLFIDNGSVVAVESMMTMKAVYSFSGETVDEVAQAYILYKSTEITPLTPEEKILQLEEENSEIKTRLRNAEYAASENSATAQGLLELLIDMEVI